MQLLLFSLSFHFPQATLFPSFATFTLHRPPLSHASPLLCGNLSHFGSAAPSSIALHDVFRFMIFLTARFCFFLSWRAAQPAEVRARLLLISKERKLGWWESPSKRRIPTSRGWKSIAPCRASLTPRNEDQGHQNCLACAQSATKKNTKRTES